MVSKTTIFYISGIAMMLTIGFIKFVNNSDFGLLSILIYFSYGGAIGILGTTKHTSFIKNVAFASVIFIVLWLLFLPIAPFDSGSFIVKQNELIVLVLLGLMFVEREFWNQILLASGKKPRMSLTFIGSILLLIILFMTGIWNALWSWWAQNWWFSILFLAIWWPFLIYQVYKAFIRDYKGLRTFFNRIFK